MANAKTDAAFVEISSLNELRTYAPQDKVNVRMKPGVYRIDDEILERLVALNAARAAEEAQGKIRYLRPDFQCPEAVQGEMLVDATPSSRSARTASATQRDEGVASTTTKKQPWPKTLPDQVQALRAALAAQPSPATAEQLARTFSRAQTKRVADLLETLATLGQAQRMDGGRYASV